MENITQNPAQLENLLDDLEINLVQANSGKRFANLLIDRGFLYLLWKFLLAKPIGTFIVSIGLYTGDRGLFFAVVWLFIVLFDLCFLAGCESLSGGKTLGKLITGTRAVNSDGTRISTKTAFLRILSRIVPFEVFSALGSPCYPWHDRWTNTFVIDEQSSQLPIE